MKLYAPSIERILLDGWESVEPCDNFFFVELVFLFLLDTGNAGAN